MRDQTFNLDLTYVTPRIIAMSFPAATITQSMYRNPIGEVARYLDDKHNGAYHVYNMSGIEYDTSPFHGRVTTGSWEDHHSPTMELLVEKVRAMYDFLNADPRNVAVVHCNAGKGRTGTLICCYLIFCHFVENAEQAISYYGWKRFANGRGVT